MAEKIFQKIIDDSDSDLRISIPDDLDINLDLNIYIKFLEYTLEKMKAAQMRKYVANKVWWMKIRKDKNQNNKEIIVKDI